MEMNSLKTPDDQAGGDSTRLTKPYPSPRGPSPKPSQNGGLDCKSASTTKDQWKNGEKKQGYVEEDYEETEKWDMFQKVTKDDTSPRSKKCLEVATKIIKVLFYIFIFLFVLSFAICSKATLLATATLYRKDSGNRSVWILNLIGMICIPYALTFLSCLMKALFGKHPWPKFPTFLLVIFIDTLHSLGISIFVFTVLPCLDTLSGILIMNAVCTLPALQQLLLTSKPGKTSKKVAFTVFDILALVLQLSAYMVASSFATFSQCSSDEKFNMTANNLIGDNVESTITIATGASSWKVPVAIFLISLHWWENFIDSDVTSGRIKQKLHGIAKNVSKTRVKTHIFVSLWKIGITFLFAYLLTKNQSAFDHIPELFSSNTTSQMKESRQRRDVTNVTTDVNDTVTSLPTTSITPGDLITTTESSDQFVARNLADILSIDENVHNYLPFIIQMFSTLFCYYFAGLACRLQMQRVSFSLPLTLVTPICIFIFSMMCNFKETASLLGDFHCPTSQLWYIFLVVGVTWWLSQLWLTRYVWCPTSNRLEFIEKLFVLPFYCGGLIEQSLLLNRRRRQDGNTSKPEFPMNDVESVSSLSTKKGQDPVTKIYICATMWHENENEMLQVLKSIFRLDYDQSARRKAHELLDKKDFDRDYYEFEGHVFFDDAMELKELDNGEDVFVVNSFVKLLVESVGNAARTAYHYDPEMRPPIKIPAPYGGRLIWVLPGGNRLVVHLKDKNKIRHRKRWSQVMYMYYLLGYKLIDLGQTDDFDLKNGDIVQEARTQIKKHRKSHFVKGDRLNHLEEDILTEAENTYLLALDGDVDFRPEAVRLLVDRMKNNPKVGAACGRIHPIGSGPMVWYQKFEYAIGHWLQKAAEHVLGCVLCAPGCFSLFRGSAIMDDNVMKTYTTKPTQARHYLQYDQGEDRWLCTLLLQQGYRVEYVAASDALTYAPETFKEFFNQRRRWVPSTMANIMDLLQSYYKTVRANDNISYLFMLYQFFIMLSTILGPATILLMIAGAFTAVIPGINVWGAYSIAILPAVLFLIICFTAKPDTQINVAAIMSALYTLVMMAVIVGTVVQIATETWLSPNAIFLIGLVVIYLICALFHPREFFNLAPGIIYFICIPSGYLLLVIYAMCNMHVVSWGTREVARKKTRKELQMEAQNVQVVMKEESQKGIHRILFGQASSAWSKLSGCWRDCCCPHTSTNQILLQEILTKLSTGTIIKDNGGQETYLNSTVATNESVLVPRNKSDIEIRVTQQDSITDDIYDDVNVVTNSRPRDELRNPYWISDSALGDGKSLYLTKVETVFWKKCVDKYLLPIDKDKQEEKRVGEELKNLRNNVAFAFFMCNALWIIIIMMLQSIQGDVKRQIFIPIPTANGELRVEPLGLVFLAFFAVVLLVQFIAMLFHRYETLLHIISSTVIGSCFKKQNNTEDDPLTVEEIVALLSEYDDETGDDEAQSDNGYESTLEPEDDFNGENEYDNLPFFSSQNGDDMSDDSVYQAQSKPKALTRRGRKGKTLRDVFNKKLLKLQNMDETCTTLSRNLTRKNQITIRKLRKSTKRPNNRI